MKYIPHFYIGVTIGVFSRNPTLETVFGFAIASLLWVAMLIIPRLLPEDKPTKLEAELRRVDALFQSIDRTVLANAEYVAKELNTIKANLQIKQLGR